MVILAINSAETSFMSPVRRSISRKSIIATSSIAPTKTAKTALRNRSPKYRDSVPVIITPAPSAAPSVRTCVP